MHDLAAQFGRGLIALAACLQVDAVSYKAFIREQSPGTHLGTRSEGLGFLRDPEVFRYANGFVAIPDGRRMGIEIDEAVVVAGARGGHRWCSPLW